MVNCLRCNHPLTDPVSIRRGYGPVCASALVAGDAEQQAFDLVDLAFDGDATPRGRGDSRHGCPALAERALRRRRVSRGVRAGVRGGDAMTITVDTLFKVLGPDRQPMHGGWGQWPEPGVWTDPIRRVIPCVNGYHVCRLSDLVSWLGPHIWTVEVRGEHIDDENKVVVGQARLVEHIDTWNDRTARLFAADCAEHVLPLYEREIRGDDRPRAAIRAARAYGRGEISEEELAVARSAAQDAVRHARWDTAGVAAWDATWAAAHAASWTFDWRSAQHVTCAAAQAADWHAGHDVDGRDAEHRWQTTRLLQYLNGELS